MSRIVIREDDRMIVLPKCSHCDQYVTDCKCGYPIWKKEGHNG